MSDGFSNSIIDGGGSLVRNQIQSPDYVPGVSGWIIKQDGTAEFNNVVVRGEVDVNGINNSYIQIVLDGSGNPFIFIKSQDIPGHVIGAGQINAFYGTNNAPGLQFVTPTIDGGSSAAIQMFGTDTVANAPSMVFSGDITILDTCNFSTDVDFLPANVGTDILFVGLQADTFKRLAINGSGQIAWGPGGASTRDTVLYRSGAGTLASDDIVANISGSGETWHAMALSNGWSNSGGSDVPAQYRLVPSPANSIQIVGSIHGGTNAQGTTIATLPAGYRPSTHKVLMPVAVDTLTAGLGTPRLTLNTTGALTIDNCTSASFVFFNIVVPLDA